MAINNIKSFVDAELDGKSFFSTWRKTPTQTTGAGIWFDLSMSPGNPVPNYYAASPNIAVALAQSTDGGISHGGNVSQLGYTKYLKTFCAMTATAAAVPLPMLLCDYLMYYPFIDTDAVGEQQDLDNTLTLPRYESGMVVCVAQSAASTVGQFTMTYTNQDGVGGRVSQNTYTFAVAGGGQVVNASGSGASYNPFVYLQAGDSGVRSIESVTFTAAGGGLMALVIVKPLLMQFLAQECRRTSSGNLESYGSCSEFQSIIHAAGAPRIKDGAVIGLLAAGYAGSLASSILAGIIETFWN